MILVPSASSLESWRAQLWSTFVRLESASASEAFYGRVEEPVAGSHLLSRVHSTVQVTERTRSNIRSDPQEVLLVTYQEAGRGFIEQDGRQCELAPGDFAIYDSGRPYRLSFDAPFKQLVYRIPRQRMADGPARLDQLTARRLDGCSGPGLIVAGYLQHLNANGAKLREDDLLHTEGAFAQMLGAALQLSGSEGSGAVDPRLDRIKLRLLRELRDPDLDVETIVTREGISLRSVQRLFQATGMTARGWIAERRLAGVAADLRAPGEAARSVTEIALSWGFNDLSHFSRAFHAHYGCSARNWRLGAQRAGGQ